MPGDATRPTSDRVRQAIFNMLDTRGEVPERVLDLYAGTGAMALEAISRGATRAVLVEVDQAMCKVIVHNAEMLGFLSQCQIERAQVLRFLKRPPAATFGWVFVDPPYQLGAEGELSRALVALSEAAIVAPAGLVIVEHNFRSPPSENHGTLTLQTTRRYGQTAVSLLLETRGEP